MFLSRFICVVYIKVFISMLVHEKIFLEGSNYLFNPFGYTLFVTLRMLAHFSQLTFLYSPKMKSTKIFQ